MIVTVGHAQNQSPPTGAAADAQVRRILGTIKASQAGTLIVTSDSGEEVTAELSTATKIVRVPPGEKDLKNATPLSPQALQPGDRVLIRAKASADGHSVAALAVIVMKQEDVTARQERDRQDWQKRGAAGVVRSVDPSGGTIMISSGALSGNRNVTVHTTRNTTIRRYAPDSVKFDDARIASLDQIKAGDQLRVRGITSPDGSEIAGEEIVAGTFRNIAGPITAIDVASNSITVQDAIGKESVVVKVSSDSQIKKLPPDMAQRIVTRIKSVVGEDSPQTTSGGQRPVPPARKPEGTGGASWQRGSGPPDLQRFLGRMPNASMGDLQKGDAVMIVSTIGVDSGTVTAITMLSGVEAILTASPNRNVIMTLSPWTLGGTSGETETAP